MKAAFTSYSGEVRGGAAKAADAAASRQATAAARPSATALPPEDELDVGAPAYLHDQARVVVVLELRVPRLEQVLSDDGDLEAGPQPPRGTQVEAVVAVDALMREGADVAIGLVELHAPGQIDPGLEGDVVPGAR